MFALNHPIAYGLLLSLLAGLATTIGSLVALLTKRPSYRILAMMVGFSVGVMIYISFVELLRNSIPQIGFMSAVSAFFLGVVTILLIDVIIPHEYIAEHLPVSEEKHFKPLTRAGVLIALGIIIHNLAKGAAVLSGSLHSAGVGIILALAVAIHNIPQGILVSFSIFHATKSRGKAFLVSFLSGISEPIGALLVVIFIWPFFTPFIVNGLLAFVAGVLVYLSFDELLHAAREYGAEHLVAAGMVLGMLVIYTVSMMLS